MKKSLFAFLASSLVATAAMAQVNPCDVNFDTKVNTADVVAVYNNIIDGTKPTKPEMEELLFEIIYQDLPLNLVMEPVEGGTFLMGATGEQADFEDDELPVHRVTLSSYYIEMSELPQAFWESVMDSNPSQHQGPFYPVENVSWDDCQTFISKLNTLLRDQLPDGMEFRLPTEAEWEFAARGGIKSMHYQYSGSNDIDEVAWYRSTSGKETHMVVGSTKKPNELGLYDMSGNVEEWCYDWHGTYVDKAQTNPVGPNTGLSRVYRGGHWSNEATLCRTSNRGGDAPTSMGGFIGFRLVLGRPISQ